MDCATFARNSDDRPRDVRDLRARRSSTSRNDLRVQPPFVAQPCAGQQPSITQPVREASDAGAHCRAGRGAAARGGVVAVGQNFDDFNLKTETLDTIWQYVLIRSENLGSDTTFGVATADPDHASRRGSGRTKTIPDTASRGPTTIVAPESQFRTCPSDHDSIGYPRMSASGESSTTMHRLLHASRSHPIPLPDDPNSIDHQVTIYLHAQNITMFPTNETWYFASQILVSSSGGLILILTAQSTRNMFRIHMLNVKFICGKIKEMEYNTHLICLWKFGLQCPTYPLLPPRKVPLEDLIYTSCTDPIPQPAAARTPRLQQPSAVTHLFYAYVRKATDTEFNVFVLGRDLILVWV
ncbi:hypothetical protein F511_41674 [Dorcoceras hygrometricum]|uniref:Uncharacterized protein n=1 Tax=Dorcoceras hygrometricum TaxID=472368 RepID=A0A2Z7AQ70_9LAMI|nr:hypothetical protein F511_41674 [Dorcoceras hygrometricum]